MSTRFIALALALALAIQGTEALPDLMGLAGFVLDNSEAVGIEMPGYMKLLSNKSSILTYLVHLLFGKRLEEQLKKVIQVAVVLMPDDAIIEDVNNDNPEKMTLHNGKMTGLKSIEVTPNTEINIITSERTGMPAGVVSLRFKDLVVTADIKTKFKWRTVDGRATMKFLENNFVAKFHFSPGIREWCYLKMYDVVITDLEDLEWEVRRSSDKTVDTVAGMLMQGYFTSTEAEVEEHIKTTIVNVIYHEIPKASPAICDNMDGYLKLSKYQTIRKSHMDKNKMNQILEEEKRKDDGKTKGTAMTKSKKE